MSSVPIADVLSISTANSDLRCPLEAVSTKKNTMQLSGVLGMRCREAAGQTLVTKFNSTAPQGTGRVVCGGETKHLTSLFSDTISHPIQSMPIFH